MSTINQSTEVLVNHSAQALIDHLIEQWVQVINLPMYIAWVQWINRPKY